MSYICIAPIWQLTNVCVALYVSQMYDTAIGGYRVTTKKSNAKGRYNDCALSFRLPRSMRREVERAAKKKKESLAEYIKTAIEFRLERDA